MTMSEDPKPMPPLRVSALLTVSVQVSARTDTLEIRGPIGDLTIPYAVIEAVERDAHGGIRINLRGATLRLFPNQADGAVDALLDLLERPKA